MLSREILDSLSIQPKVDRSSPIITQIKEYIFENGYRSLIELSRLNECINGYLTSVNLIYLKAKKGIKINIKEEIDKIVTDIKDYAHGLLNNTKPKNLNIEIELKEEKDIALNPALSAWNFSVKDSKSDHLEHKRYFEDFNTIFLLILNYIKPQSFHIIKDKKEEKKLDEAKVELLSVRVDLLRESAERKSYSDSTIQRALQQANESMVQSFVVVPIVVEKKPTPEEIYLDRCSLYTQTYIKSFAGKKSHSDIVKEINLNEEELSLLSECIDSITYEIMDRPVILHEQAYDFSTVVKLNKVDPQGIPFDHQEIQPSRKAANAFEDNIKKIIEARKAHNASKKSVGAPGGPSFG